MRSPAFLEGAVLSTYKLSEEIDLSDGYEKLA